MKHRPKPARLACECLEQRLALAGLFTYTDVDGDLVTVKTSKGGNADLAAALTLSGGTSGQLQKVNLATNPVFAGTDFSLTVKKAGGGDGLAAVGHIDASLVDLGKISISGDLGRVVAGDVNSATTGVVSLAVASLGRYGTTTGAPDIASSIRGDLKALAVKGDIRQAGVTMIGGGIGKLTIGGSLVGGVEKDSGRIVAGTIGPVKIGGDIVGGGGQWSASISSNDAIASVTVGNSIVGGAGAGSGSVVAGNTIGSLKVGRDIVGAAGQGSASIQITLGASGARGIGDVTVGGSVLGGDGNSSGFVYAIGIGFVPTVKIGGDVRGGGGTNSGSLIIARAKKLSIGGSLIGGSGNEYSGAVYVPGKIDSMTVRGSVVGAAGKYSGSISAPNSPGVSFGTILVGGSVAGGKGEKSGSIVNEGDRIGKVTVRGAVSGGAGDSSGMVAAASIGSAAVGGNVTGGAGTISGSIVGVMTTRIRVGGSLFGGSGGLSGSLVGQGQLADVAIAKDLVGGVGTFSGSVFSDSGSITKVAVGGSVIGGIGPGSATIGALGTLASLTVKGAMVGKSAAQPLQVVGGSGVGTVTVGGAVSSTVFLAGWQPDRVDGIANPLNGNASIGKIVVKGDFAASSIAAGVNSALFPLFGTQLDTTIPGGTACSIGSVVIGGNATGSGDPLQHFGIVSRTIGSVKVKGVAVAIPAANANTPIGNTDNFVIRVISI